jgi:hypothetical protein
MCMEPISTVSLPGCYIATVNESETITDAKPFCRDRSQIWSLRGRERFRAKWIPVRVKETRLNKTLEAGKAPGFPATAQFERS